MLLAANYDERKAKMLVMLEKYLSNISNTL